MSTPVAIDLCHGHGGWTNGFLAEGYQVIGCDINTSSEYRGVHIEQDVRLLAAELKAGNQVHHLIEKASVIVASPPCEEFSRHQMPWTRKRNPPPPDLSIWRACVDIADTLGLPIVIENVRAAQGWMGKAKWHCGSFYLWGDVPALMPRVKHRPKESYGSANRLERAMIPLDLALWIAKCFYPVSRAAIDSPLNAGAMVAQTVSENVLIEATA